MLSRTVDSRVNRQRLQIFDDRLLATVPGPAERGVVENRVDNIDAGAAFDEEPDHLQEPIPNGLMNWRGVAVGAGRIEAVGIFAGVEQETGGFHLTGLSRQAECGGGAVAEHQGGIERGSPIPGAQVGNRCAVGDEEVNERDLNARYGWMVARDQQAHGRAFPAVKSGERIYIRTSVEEAGGDGHGVGG